ncbi:MAG: hypothetical protein ABR532_08995 [Candidatus Dormibacteria bacterium]
MDAVSFQADLEARVRYRAAQIAGNAREILERDLKRAAPVGTPSPYQTHEPGQLRDSLTVSVRFDQVRFTFTAKTDVAYASYTNEGTGPHPIVAVNVRVLRFDWPRAGLHPAFLPRVSHPGTSGTHWWDNALSRWPDTLAAAQ